MLLGYDFSFLASAKQIREEDKSPPPSSPPPLFSVIPGGFIRQLVRETEKESKEARLRKEAALASPEREVSGPTGKGPGDCQHPPSCPVSLLESFASLCSCSLLIEECPSFNIICWTPIHLSKPSLHSTSLESSPITFLLLISTSPSMPVLILVSRVITWSCDLIN